MHPIVILVPAAVLIFGPRLWVNQVLKRNNRENGECPLKAAELARELLDKHGLQSVRVEVTDRGDHYDPQCRAVRLARDKYDRGTLTAVTTAAHEVAHALQHANGYGPFIWRTRLTKLAQVTGEISGGLLLAVPVTAVITRTAVPRAIVGMAILSMLGTGVIAQVAALPSELDASFNRAMPMLRTGYIDGSRTEEARRILLACSLTYVASSLVSVISFLPWIGGGGYVRRPVPVRPTRVRRMPLASLIVERMPLSDASSTRSQGLMVSRPRHHVDRMLAPVRRPGEVFLRRTLKPLIRAWLALVQ